MYIKIKNKWKHSEILEGKKKWNLYLVNHYQDWKKGRNIPETKDFIGNWYKHDPPSPVSFLEF